MKIDIAYEKKDILRLVQQDMEAQGIRVKVGTTLEYKGALQVKFSVETEGDVPAPAPEVAAKPTVSVSSAPLAPATTPVEDSARIAGVVAASQHLVMTQPGKFERRPARALANSELMQESTEFPKR